MGIASFPKSLTQPFRRGQILVGGAWRAYFAPFNPALANTSEFSNLGPNILDLQVQGPFSDANLPANYNDLGWINQFKMTPASKIGSVRSGWRGAIRAQYRGQVGESFEFRFRETSRMSWKIATGTEMFNLLVNPNATASTLGPLSSSGALAQPLGASGYLATGIPATASAGLPTLCVPAGIGANYSGNEFIACDVDCINPQQGLNGSYGIPFVIAGQVTDIDFFRKTTDFVARVVNVIPNVASGQDALILNKPFVGGGSAAMGAPPYGPAPTAKIQQVKGYAAREGGTYIMEWSALFLCSTYDGSQIAIWYPHVAPNQFKELANWQLENAGTTDLTGYELDAVFEALAFDDPLDGETVVRYAAFYPSPTQDIQI